MMPRQHERKSYFTEITLESGSGKREARISEFSLGGCFVDTITHVREGEEVSLTGTLDTGEHLHMRGVVAYVMDGFGFGVKFIELDEESQNAIKKIVASP